ncbi:MAG: divergent polysaccharide deacetylase family protein [Rhodospirillaceae bacterium]|nr:divergent polysaccharide deacetylase family protein [Rhodospirillaceae bacterium]
MRPIFLIALGIALLGFGLISGIALDLAMRPKDRLPASLRPVAAKPAPTTQNLSSLETLGEVPNVRPERRTGQPMRAWAPDVVPERANDEPMVAFAVPATAQRDRPAIAIVIDDMGVDRARSLRMIELKGPITLSLMTYADNLPDLAARARRAGHEVMAHLPMEPIDPKENPGKGALRVSMDEAAIRATLAADLDPWNGYVGINNHMGSRFTTDRARMNVVMAELKSRGLLWLDSKTIQGSAGTAAAQAAGVPYIERDVFIDNEQTVDAVLAQLADAEKVARSRGSAIAIGHPHEATLDALARWLPEADRKGIALVPVTEVLRRRTSAP